MQGDGLSRLRVDIFGTEYTLRGRASIEHLHWVAEKVDAVMRQIASGNPSLDPKRLAVLAAINIADELHRVQMAADDAATQGNGGGGGGASNPSGSHHADGRGGSV